jgi:hypothetical protein
MEKHLNAALGYLGLGMAKDAWDELERIDKSEKINLLAFWRCKSK